MTSSTPRGTRTAPRFWRLSSLAVVASLALSACADFSGIQSRGTLRPASTLGLDSQTTSVAPPWARQDWWTQYGDAQLNSLLTQALAGNPSLQQASLRLERAQALAGGSEAALLPQVGAVADLSRDLYTSNGLYPKPLAGSVRSMGTLQASGSWELDFFGKNRAALDAALGAVQAAAADAQAARLLLASQVLRTYFQWARQGQQLAVAQRTLEQREEMLGLVQSRLKAGLDTQLELRQSQGSLPDARLQIEALQEQIGLTRNALAALVGDPALAPRLVQPVLPEQISADVPAQVPVNLVGQRADVVAARWRVEAASRDTDTARAQFYPNINLKAYVGLSAFGFSNVLKSSSEQAGVSPALSLPIFEGGRLRANLKAKTADLDSAIAAYNGAVLEAVHDVSDQLLLSESLWRQQALQHSARQAAEDAYAIARQRYQAGLGTYLQVLSAETQVLAQRRASVDLAARTVDTQVALWRALGGGWTPQTVAVAPQGAVASGLMAVQSALAGPRSAPAVAPNGPPAVP
ncbi:efflux transporter outer membrane subunit [Curvibacter sp. HBC61]|uniref:Efflux transporter outer membrane subunit n=1 Tax=Curvibacter cyanobacteriorum TaxID=3026422 RepID=A0ABT5N3Z6_9BURK|nr:efflux transporter outer membrane subunit [Curvibacter sp. HBC61]MDD0840845.1 efflux transporter outer membrane subunit [Curvibacter sp. HBC61]